MNCNKCGNPISEDAKFCNACGAPVQSVEPVNVSQNPSPNEAVNASQNVNNLEINSGVEENAPINNSVNVNNVEVNTQPINNEEVSLNQNLNNNNSNMVQNNSVNNINNQKKSNKTPLIIAIVVIVIFIGLIVVLALTGGIKFNATITANGTTKQFNAGDRTKESTPAIEDKKENDVNKEESSNSSTSISEIPVGNINVFDKIKLLDLDTIKTYEQVVSLFGASGVKDETTTLNKYKWTQDDKTSLDISFYVSEYSPDSGSILSASITYERDDLKDDLVNLSEAATLANTVQAQTPVYYDEIVRSFGTEGVLIELSSTSREYIWVNNMGGYVTARFDSKTNQCRYFFGRV